MIQTVIKRDGRVVGYNEEKIKAAIRKAMITTEKGEDESLIQKITDRIGMNGKEQMSVEEIQDNVELELMKSSRKEVAKRYIAYRDQRSIARRAKTRDIFLEIIEAKSNDITRENANMNADSPAGMMMKPMPLTTCAAMRLGSRRSPSWVARKSSNPYCETIIISALPSATRK